MSWMPRHLDKLLQVHAVTYLSRPEMSALMWPMELWQWATEAVGRPEWSLPKFRETEMEMPSTLTSKVPSRVLIGSYGKQWCNVSHLQEEEPEAQSPVPY